MRMAISQPRYLPAVNYLQRIHHSELFVILDNVQRQGRGVENRNKIVMNGKEKLLTVPVASSSREIIRKTVIDGADWVALHRDHLHNAYKNHPFYKQEYVERYFGNIETVLKETGFSYCRCLLQLVQNACDLFGLRSNFKSASEFTNDEQAGPEKPLQICKAVGAGEYISGVNGKSYGIEETFKGSGIKILYHLFDFPSYPQYKNNVFVPWTCFFDLLFNLGFEKTSAILIAPPCLKETV